MKRDFMFLRCLAILYGTAYLAETGKIIGKLSAGDANNPVKWHLYRLVQLAIPSFGSYRGQTPVYSKM